MQNKQNRMKALTYAGLTLCLLIIIFVFSNQAGSQSYSVSSWVTALLENTPIGRVLSRIDVSMEFSIRKCAHVFLYCALGLFSSLFFLVLCQGRGKQISAAAVFCFVAAAFDEWHQTFIPGRNGHWQDVGVDAIGFGSAILVVHVLHWLFSIGGQSEKVR